MISRRLGRARAKTNTRVPASHFHVAACGEEADSAGWLVMTINHEILVIIDLLIVAGDKRQKRREPLVKVGRRIEKIEG